ASDISGSKSNEAGSSAYDTSCRFEIQRGAKTASYFITTPFITGIAWEAFWRRLVLGGIECTQKSNVHMDVRQESQLAELLAAGCLLDGAFSNDMSVGDGPEHSLTQCHTQQDRSAAFYLLVQ